MILHANAQSGNWLYGFGSEQNDEAISTCTDASGNSYTTGYFFGKIEFGPYLLSASGSRDIFILKQDRNGNILWAKRAGGAMSDKPYKIACDGQGNVFITGYFTGVATFGSTSLVSSNSSEDIFVTKLSSSGSFMWAKAFGGTYNDAGLSLTTDPSGNICVTGMFKGSVNFQAQTFTSINQSFDIFLIKLNSNGNVLWAKHGKGNQDDRGIAITSDEDGNFYLSGQFSNNLTFTQVQQNNGMNANFLMKFSPSGIESWVRMFYATRILINDITYSKGHIYFTGDMEGYLYITGQTATVVSNLYAQKIFIGKSDTSGTIGWVRLDGSQTEISAKAICADTLSNAYVAGIFKCKFSEYSAANGSGLFNSVGMNDVFTVKYNANGERQWERQFGGPKDDWCSAISVYAENEIMLAGSFERRFNVPSTPSFILNSTVHDSTAYGAAQVLCEPYNAYISTTSAGAKDVFLARPFHQARSTYDFFERSGCQKDSVLPVINNGADSVFACDSAKLTIVSRTGSPGIIGPEYNVTWSNGATGSSVIVTTSGLYYADITYTGSCMSFRDYIYVDISGAPMVPEITSSAGLEKQAIPVCLNKLILDGTNPTVLTANSLTPGYPYRWETPSGVIHNTPSIPASLPGEYELIVTTPTGACARDACKTIMTYTVTGGTGNLPNDTLTPLPIFGHAQRADTVYICGDYLDLMVVDSMLHASGYDTIPLFADWTISQNLSFEYYSSFPSTFLYHKQVFYADSGGPTTIKVSWLDPVSLDLLDSLTLSFFLKKVDLTSAVSLQITGPSIFCEGDTATLTVTGDPGYQLSGSGIVSVSPSTNTFRVNQPGYYEASISLFDSISQCSDIVTSSFHISHPSMPRITMQPANGMVCPGDSVKLTAEQGLQYTWYGPNGNTVGSTKDIWVTTPGDYHYDLINPQGCFLVSSSSEVKEYTTPFIQASPSAVICPGSSIELGVVTSDTTSISWTGPVISSASYITATDTGYYYCSVNSCGINTIDTLHVKYSSFKVNITPDTAVFCSSSSTVLQASFGMNSYSWSPGNSTSENLTVESPGVYYVTVTDEYGCISEDSAYVEMVTSPGAPLFPDTTVCQGADLSFTVNTSLAVTWYNSSMDPIDSTATIYFSDMRRDTIVYIVVTDSICGSAPEDIVISITPTPPAPSLPADTLICEGERIMIHSAVTGSFDFIWNTPKGIYTDHDSLYFSSVDSTWSGNYILTLSNGSCAGTPDTISVMVVNRNIYTVTGDTALCEHDTLSLHATGNNATSVHWLTAGAQTVPGGVLTLPSVQPGDAGFYQLVIEQSGCSNDTIPVKVSVSATPVADITGSTKYCKGDTVVLANADSAGAYEWQIGSSTYTGQQISFVSDTLHSYVILTATNGTCAANDSIRLVVKSRPKAVVYGDHELCEGDTMKLWADSTYNSVTWFGPNGFSSQNHTLSAEVNTDSEGVYILTIQDSLECSAEPDTVHVTGLPKPAFTLGDDITACSDTILLLEAPAGYVQYIWNGISGTSQFQTGPGGEVHLTVINEYGCSATDTIQLSMVSCELMVPNFFTPNGDGVNDKFFITNGDERIIKFSVMNRWGETVITFTSPFLWDGLDKEGKPVITGTYYYTFEYFEDGESRSQQGFIHVSR